MGCHRAKPCGHHFGSGDLPGLFLALSPVYWLAFSLPGCREIQGAVVSPKPRGSRPRCLACLLGEPGWQPGGQGIARAWGLGPKHWPCRPAQASPKGSRSSNPVEWTGSSWGGPTQSWSWRHRYGGLPHYAMAVIVPAHTCMHAATRPHASVPWPTHTQGCFLQENPLPGPYTPPWHAGLPTVDPQGQHADSRLTHMHIHSHLCI